MKLKRSLSALVAMTMISSTLLPVHATNTVDSVKCNVRVMIEQDTKVPSTSLNVEAGTAKEYGFSDVDSQPTLADALVEIAYYDYYEKDGTKEEIINAKDVLTATVLKSITPSQYGYTMMDVFDKKYEGNYSWGYSNNTLSSMGLYENVKNGDDVKFYYYNWNVASEGFFEQYNYYVKPNTAFNVAVGKYTYDAPLYKPVFTKLEGAKVTLSKDGQSIGVYSSNKDGIVELPRLDEGVYELNGSWSNDTSYIVPAYAKLNVTNEAKPEELNTTVRNNVSSTQNVYNDMKALIAGEKVSNMSKSDIDAFWYMLANTAMNNKATALDVKFEELDYSKMNPQKLAKVIIAMANNRYDVNSKLVNGKSVIEALVSYLDADGSFTYEEVKASSNEQVWCMLALEIADAKYDQTKAVQYLSSLQMENGAFGYGSYPDVAVTRWVLNLNDLVKLDENVVAKADAYCKAQWDGLVATNDSSSMAAYVSTLRATDEMVKQFLDASYNEAEKYFTWGTSAQENLYAKYQSIQSLADHTNKKSVYVLLDETCDGTVVETEKQTTKENVKTGDDTLVMTYISMLAASAVIFFIAKRRYE